MHLESSIVLKNNSTLTKLTTIIHLESFDINKINYLGNKTISQFLLRLSFDNGGATEED